MTRTGKEIQVNETYSLWFNGGARLLSIGTYQQKNDLPRFRIGKFTANTPRGFVEMAVFDTDRFVEVTA